MDHLCTQHLTWTLRLKITKAMPTKQRMQCLYPSVADIMILLQLIAAARRFEIQRTICCQFLCMAYRNAFSFFSKAGKHNAPGDIFPTVINFSAIVLPNQDRIKLSEHTIRWTGLLF